MEDNTLLQFILFLLLFLFFIRYILIFHSIKKYSELFNKLIELNNQYKSYFHSYQKRINVDFTCNSLQQYRKNCNKSSIITFMCGIIRENEEKWLLLYNQSNSNKNNLKKYFLEFDLLEENYHGKSYEKIRKSTFLFSERQYKKFEKWYCHKKNLNPQTTLNVKVDINYTSPAGRNSYAMKYELTNESIDEIFVRMEDRKLSEKSIDFQRLLMSSGKRYDILKRDHFQCQICGRTKSDGAKLEVDHIIPISKGGKTIDENLQTLCYECNQGKKAKL